MDLGENVVFAGRRGRRQDLRAPANPSARMEEEAVVMIMGRFINKMRIFVEVNIHNLRRPGAQSYREICAPSLSSALTAVMGTHVGWMVVLCLPGDETDELGFGLNKNGRVRDNTRGMPRNCQSINTFKKKVYVNPHRSHTPHTMW
jgi:hypothetical protein